MNENEKKREQIIRGIIGALERSTISTLETGVRYLPRNVDLKKFEEYHDAVSSVKKFYQSLGQKLNEIGIRGGTIKK